MDKLSQEHGISIKTIRKYFDDYSLKPHKSKAPIFPINLLYEATFFGREYGFIVFHDNKSVVYFEEINDPLLTQRV